MCVNSHFITESFSQGDLDTEISSAIIWSITLVYISHLVDSSSSFDIAFHWPLLEIIYKLHKLLVWNFVSDGHGTSCKGTCNITGFD